MRSIAAIVCLSALGFLGGCAGLDPWGEFDALPESRSQSFHAEIDAEGPSSADSPNLASELTGRTLSLGECVSVALEHNPRTAESWQAIRSAAARAGRAKADYLPAVGFSSGASRGDPAELDGQVDRGTQNRYDAVFGLRWLLWDGGGRAARVDAATAEVLAVGFRHNAGLQDVTLEVVEAYYGLLAARSFRELAVETVRQRDYQLRLAKARHEAGVVAKSDVLRAEAEKAAADLDLVRAKNAIHLTQGRLASAMGVRVSVGFQIRDAPPVDYSAELTDIEILLDEAARNRPELRAAVALVRSREASVRIAESRYWPTISLDTSFGWLGRTFLPGQRQWSVGADLDLPLWTGFDRNYQLHGSKADLDRAVAARQAVLQGVELEVWRAYWQTIEAAQAIRAAERFVASAEESARVAQGEYKSGTGTMVNLIDAQTQRTAARDRLIQARLDWRTARARFERAVGRSLTDRAKPLARQESE
ncbi:MAG: TolC family protein [Planctomycetota bacterium]